MEKKIKVIGRRATRPESDDVGPEVESDPQPRVPKGNDDPDAADEAGRASLPQGISADPSNPFRFMKPRALWHRRGSRRGVVEVVIVDADGHVIKGSFKELPGFYEVGVSRHSGTYLRALKS